LVLPPPPPSPRAARSTRHPPSPPPPPPLFNPTPLSATFRPAARGRRLELPHSSPYHSYGVLVGGGRGGDRPPVPSSRRFFSRRALPPPPRLDQADSPPHPQVGHSFGSTACLCVLSSVSSWLAPIGKLFAVRPGDSDLCLLLVGPLRNVQTRVQPAPTPSMGLISRGTKRWFRQIKGGKRYYYCSS
jgi:hypothetical protein